MGKSLFALFKFLSYRYRRPNTSEQGQSTSNQDFRKRPGLGAGKAAYDQIILKIKEPEDLKKHPAILEKLSESAKKTNPVSALYEVATKLHWGPPNFVQTFTGGPPNQKTFIFKCKMNDKEYQPSLPVVTKKLAKSKAAEFTLQELGLLPKDPNNPI